MSGIPNKFEMVSILQPFGQRPVRIHCPICGKKIETGNENVDPCEHLCFRYIGEWGGFVYTSDDFDQSTSGLENEDIDMMETLTKAGYGPELLVLKTISGGMGCGPILNSVIHGFDFSIPSDEDEEEEEE